MSASENSPPQAEVTFVTQSNASIEVGASDSSIRCLCVLLTEPINDDFLKCKGSPIDLKTNSHHQGKVEFPDKGSWSWFELAVIPSYAPVSKLHEVDYEIIKTARKKLSWIAYHHPVDQSGQPETFDHRFPGDHEIWKYLQVGDRLAVFACAQFPGWSCAVKYTELKLAVDESRRKDRELGTKMVQGTAIQKSFIMFEFKVDGRSRTFDATLFTSLPPFTFKDNTVVKYNKDGDLTGTYSFSGYIGESDYSMLLKTDWDVEVATISGSLGEHIKDRINFRGIGTWIRN